MQYNLNCNSFLCIIGSHMKSTKERFTHVEDPYDQYDHLLSMKIYTFTVNKMFIWAPKVMRALTMRTIWGWLLSHPNVKMTIDTCLPLTLRCFQLIYWMPKYNFHVGFEWVSSNGGLLCDVISINQVNQHQYSSTPTWMGAHSPLQYHFKIMTFKRSRKHSTMYGWVYWTQYVYAWPSPTKATWPIFKNTRARQSHLSQRKAINILTSCHMAKELSEQKYTIIRWKWSCCMANGLLIIRVKTSVDFGI